MQNVKAFYSELFDVIIESLESSKNLVEENFS